MGIRRVRRSLNVDVLIRFTQRRNSGRFSIGGRLPTCPTKSDRLASRIMKLLCFAALALSMLLAGAAPDGEALYKARCAACHDGKPQPRMPSREDIGKR